MSEELDAQTAAALQKLFSLTAKMDAKLDYIVEEYKSVKLAQDEQRVTIEELKKSVRIAGWTRKGVAFFATSGAAVGLLAFLTGAAKAALLWAGGKL